MVPAAVSAIPWRLLGVLAVAVASAWAGSQWQAGRAAQAELAVRDQAAELQRLQRRAMDAGALQHAEHLRTLNRQLGAAHARIAQLAGRDCLDPGTVGVLNDIGGAVRAAAGQPAPAAAAPAADRGDGIPGGAGLRYSTDRDVAAALAVCRARYAEVSGQLDAILDIEEARHGPVGPPATP